MDLSPALAEYGLPGIVIAALLAAVAYLFRKYAEVQDKRIEETRETLEAINNNTNALNTLSELLRVRIGGS